ncbi:MAG: MBL fold metallo-hydrolase [Bacteroidia bacterium]|nr:MBL fold metallo-hydrolase [Bacteroidia bacterium]
MINIQSFTFNPFQENTYVLSDKTKKCIIIDPGCYESYERDMLVKYIETDDLTPVKLLNTHCHIDHIFGNQFIAKKYDLKLEMHELDLPVLHAADQAGMIWGVNCDKSPEPEVFLTENDTIEFGDSELEIMLTPGHSPGSIVFYNKIEKFAVAGDVLFLQSIGRTDLPGGDHDTLISSIKNKLFLLDDDLTVYPGHGPETAIGFEKLNNPFLI